MILKFAHLLRNPDEAAAWWSARRRLDISGIGEERLFRKWLQQPRHAAAWERVERPLDATSAYAAMPEILAMRDAALGAGAPEARSYRRGVGIGRLAAAAAAILLVVAVPVGLDTLQIGDAPPAVAVQRIATAIGEQRDLRLADGSQVKLDTASAIEVAYNEDRREIRLLSGQALFRVAKGERPFVVRAGDRLITAHGTAFDVRLTDKGAVRVLLVEGKVSVEPADRSAIERLLPALVREELDPGEQLSVSGNVASRTVTADIVSATSWTQGQLIFRDDRIADALAEVNRYSTDKIVVQDPAISDLRISGVFRAERHENFLAALTSFYPIEAEPKGSGLIVLKWRENGGKTNASS